MINLKNTARTAGAKTFKIEAVLANDELLQFLVRRYGIKTDPLTNKGFIELIKEATKDTASTLIVEHQNMITELSIQYANGKLRDIFPMKHVFTRIMQKVTRSKDLE